MPVMHKSETVSQGLQLSAANCGSNPAYLLGCCLRSGSGNDGIAKSLNPHDAPAGSLEVHAQHKVSALLRGNPEEFFPLMSANVSQCQPVSAQKVFGCLLATEHRKHQIVDHSPQSEDQMMSLGNASFADWHAATRTVIDVNVFLNSTCNSVSFYPTNSSAFGSPFASLVSPRRTWW